MTVLIIETSDGTKTIELGLLTRIMLHFDDGSDMTLHASGDGLEIRSPRLNRRLVVRPNAVNSITIGAEKDYEA